MRCHCIAAAAAASASGLLLMLCAGQMPVYNLDFIPLEGGPIPNGISQSKHSLRSATPRWLSRSVAGRRSCCGMHPSESSTALVAVAASLLAPLALPASQAAQYG